MMSIDPIEALRNVEEAVLLYIEDRHGMPKESEERLLADLTLVKSAYLAAYEIFKDAEKAKEEK